MNRRSHAQLWSFGAQPERTALAWSRTALAGATLLGVLVRQLLPTHPVAGVALAVVAVPVVVAVVAAARARYRTGRRALRTDRALPDARLAAGCVLLTTLVALAAGLYVAAG
ncbi:DUF202 domain-containing protein [Phytohabitans houttuyneae]|uniref:DUF202 domain-containing protein n=1 Tax=Phytohabitans houttuyneae TaxID=1076126 RepID=A0A6V8KG19_9ACTN|nr:DUF202 domain-containing protein [Phytohabitans houttuyneae]GFJ80976.1 hypothetical protein Phou_051560 [Phytohabitans houttuyneae]